MRPPKMPTPGQAPGGSARGFGFIPRRCPRTVSLRGKYAMPYATNDGICVDALWASGAVRGTDEQQWHWRGLEQALGDRA
jgi:hypothetical protein